MRLVFDLDGVLVDSREANLQAYRSVGAMPPENFYSVAWETWCGDAVHDAKCRAFPQYVALIRPLPLLGLALREHGVVLTLCSESSLKVLHGAIPDLGLLLTRYGIRDKAAALSAMGAPGVYFDDSLAACEEISRRTEWQVVHVL